MVPLESVLAFAAVAFVLIVVPGPSVLFVLSRAVALGRRAALATVVGNAAGVYVQVVAVAAGVGTIVERSVLAFTVVKFVGAGYLVLLGVHALRHRRALTEVAAATMPSPLGLRRLMVDGFVVGAANPKSIVFFTAMLPQFVDPARGWVPLQLLVLGLVFVAIALLSDGTWGLAAGSARSWLARSPRRLETLGGIGGLTMVGLGLRLLTTGRKD